jgi:N-dimethylarginine dimethylaminohydrolase
MSKHSANRREFLKATGVTAAAVAIGANPRLTTAKENKAVSKPIMAHHEWGKLKEVIVGYPYFYFPAEAPDYITNFLTDEAVKRYKSFAGTTIDKGLPDLWREQMKQVNATIKILKDRGIKVYQLKTPLEHERLHLRNQGDFYQTFCYPRDEIVVVGNNYIEVNMLYPGRRMTRWSFRRTAGERVQASNARIVSMPEPPVIATEDGDYGPGPFLEGGDVMLFGRDILVGVSGNASNTAGVKWLQRYLGDEYRVQEVKLDKHFLHLDCTLCTPRPGLAMICKEAFVDGIPELFKDWKHIYVTPKDAEGKLACNGLVLDEKSIIIADTLPHLAKQLRDAGQEVIETPFDAMYWQGGGFRCWHHPLVRESKLEAK